MNLKRILMTAADQPGGSTTAPPATTPPAVSATTPPAQPQAQGAPVLTADAIRAMLTEHKDSLFAELRRAGVFGTKPLRSSNTTTSDPPQPPVAAAGADPTSLRALDRALTRAGHATRLTEAQYSRLERAFVAEAPENVEGWVTAYFEGWGSAPTTPAPTGASTAAAPQPRSAVPVSDGGTPPAPQVPIEQRDILSLSDEDRAHLVKTKGPAWYREQLRKQTQGKAVRLR